MNETLEPQGQPAGHRNLVAAGYTAALLLPLIGAIIGLVLFHRGETRHGLGVIGVSLFFMALALATMVWLQSMLQFPT